MMCGSQSRLTLKSRCLQRFVYLLPPRWEEGKEPDVLCILFICGCSRTVWFHPALSELLQRRCDIISNDSSSSLSSPTSRVDKVQGMLLSGTIRDIPASRREPVDESLFLCHQQTKHAEVLPYTKLTWLIVTFARPFQQSRSFKYHPALLLRSYL